MMAHWEQRDHWIGGIGANVYDGLKEIWVGARLNELKWFWDPSLQWMLPMLCNYCGAVISSDEIEMSRSSQGIYEVLCEECGSMNQVHPKYTNGEPRNIALIGHWDGWQPFGNPGSHSCGR